MCVSESDIELEAARAHISTYVGTTVVLTINRSKSHSERQNNTVKLKKFQARAALIWKQ